MYPEAQCEPNGTPATCWLSCRNTRMIARIWRGVHGPSPTVTATPAFCSGHTPPPPEPTPRNRPRPAAASRPRSDNSHTHHRPTAGPRHRVMPPPARHCRTSTHSDHRASPNNSQRLDAQCRLMYAWAPLLAGGCGRTDAMIWACQSGPHGVAEVAAKAARLLVGPGPVLWAVALHAATTPRVC